MPRRAREDRRRGVRVALRKRKRARPPAVTIGLPAAVLRAGLETRMDESMQRKIVGLLDAHRVMRIATLRPDGWPQVTTVGYVNEGLALWFLCGPDSQKARNLACDARVSLAIDHDTPDILAITGLSMAARARRVDDPAEAERIVRALPSKYPDDPPAVAEMEMPAARDLAVFRVEPQVISVLDYRLGFGHADLVRM